MKGKKRKRPESPLPKADMDLFHHHIIRMSLGELVRRHYENLRVLALGDEVLKQYLDGRVDPDDYWAPEE